MVGTLHQDPEAIDGAYKQLSQTTRFFAGDSVTIEKNSDVDKIVSIRQRESTSKQARGWPWEMSWSVRSVGKRGSGQVAGQLGVARSRQVQVYMDCGSTAYYPIP